MNDGLTKNKSTGFKTKYEQWFVAWCSCCRGCCCCTFTYNGLAIIINKLEHCIGHDTKLLVSLWLYKHNYYSFTHMNSLWNRNDSCRQFFFCLSLDWLFVLVAFFLLHILAGKLQWQANTRLNGI